MTETIGSIIPQETKAAHMISANVLTMEGIMAKHNLTKREYLKIKEQLGGRKLLDILFHYPDGPRYDIALNMVAASR